jgi:hypothetical protein
MNSQKIRSTYVVCVILFGISLNAIYGIELWRSFFDPQFDNATREIIISAIALEFGWAALLLWVLFKQGERRHVLLMTAIPIAIGNLLHSLNQSLFAEIGPTKIVLNLAIGGMVVGSFVLAFFFSPKYHHNLAKQGKSGELQGSRWIYTIEE